MRQPLGQGLFSVSLFSASLVSLLVVVGCGERERGLKEGDPSVEVPNSAQLEGPQPAMAAGMKRAFVVDVPDRSPLTESPSDLDQGPSLPVKKEIEALSGLALAKRLRLFFSLAGTGKIEVKGTQREASLNAVRYQLTDGDLADSDEKKAKIYTAYVSLDGAWMSQERIDLQKRVQQLAADRALVDCLADKGVRIFVGGSDPQERALFRALGTFAETLVVDCKGPAAARCAALGYGQLPVIAWPHGAEIGFKDRAWFARTLGCEAKVPESARLSVAAEGEDLGREGIEIIVRKLQEVSSSRDMIILETARIGGLYRVALRTLKAGGRVETAWLTPNGRYLLPSIVNLPHEIQALRRIQRLTTCLLSVGVRIFVRRDQLRSRALMTSLRLRSSELWVDCTAEPKRCKQAGVKETPAIAMKGRSPQPGPRDRAWLSSYAGCLATLP